MGFQVSRAKLTTEPTTAMVLCNSRHQLSIHIYVLKLVQLKAHTQFKSMTDG